MICFVLRFVVVAVEWCLSMDVGVCCCCLLFVVWCVLFNVCCLLSVVCCLLYDV